MTSKRWPILDLDADASEGEIRRAYAERLRERRPDDDAAAFGALRTEYQAALSVARQRSLIEVPRVVTIETPETEPLEHVPSSARAIREIRGLLVDGEVMRACERYDRARSIGEIGIADERPIELQLARAFLIDDTVSSNGLYEIARRYGWDDALSKFPLADEIVAKYRPAAPPRVKPGTKFIGTWNWGAFFFPGLWLINHGRRTPGSFLVVFVQLVLSVNVIVYAVFFLWMAVRCGRNANSIAVASGRFKTDEQFVLVQNRWRNWGGGVYCAWLLYESVVTVASFHVK